MKLFEKYSYRWIWCLTALLLVNMLALVVRGLLMHQPLIATGLGSFFFVPLLVSTIITLGGFLGFKTYFLATASINLISILYMLIVTLTRSSGEWSDLAGVVAYLYISGIGAVVGAAAELLVSLLRKAKK